MAGGPAKLSENTKIQRRNATLADDFYGAAPGTGIGFVSNIAQLLSLIAGQAPTFAFADNTELLANVTVQPNYFTRVADNGSGLWEVRLYIGGDRTNIANYPLVVQQGGQTLMQVLTKSNSAGTLQIKNLGDATDDQDAVSLLQMQTAIAAVIQHFKGTYIDEAALASAHPTADPGDYAYVDAGVGTEAAMWIWDDDDEEWVLGGTAIAPDATSSVKGVMKLYSATGSNTDGTMTQMAILTALNLKSNSVWTITSKSGAYTLAAAELTALSSGASLVMEGDNTGDLTVPLNATVAFSVGHTMAVRGFGNIVATGGVGITGTNGTLAIPTGRTVILEKTDTNTWILHNGAPISAGTTTTMGSFEAADQTEAEAQVTQAIAGSTTGLSSDRVDNELGIYYMLRKLFSVAVTWAIGPTITDATASTPAWFNGSKKLVTAVVTDLLDWLGINPIAVSVSLSSTTITLDCGSKYSRKWYTSTAHSANFTLTKTNKTNNEYGHYVFPVTGTVVVQLDTDDRMPDDMIGWNLGSKQLTIVSGGTGLLYSLAWTKVGSNYFVTLSSKATV